jgi:hypothetical protein
MESARHLIPYLLGVGANSSHTYRYSTKTGRTRNQLQSKLSLQHIESS